MSLLQGTGKFIMAPFPDRCTCLPLGRRRPWVLFRQLGLLLSFFAMAKVRDPLNNRDEIMLTGFFVSFFAAFQDLATDSMATDIKPLNEQARANGLMWGSKTIEMKFCWKKVSATTYTICMVITNLGFSVNPTMISPVKDRWGWEVTVLFFAIILSMALILLQLMMSKTYEQQLDAIQEEALLLHHPGFGKK